MADIFNTVIDQGATWNILVTYNDPNGNPINISGCTAALQLRTSPLAATTALSLTTSNGGIVITPLDGELAITATATQTGSLSPLKYTYDLELYGPGATVTRLMQGTILVNPETTRI